MTKLWIMLLIEISLGTSNENLPWPVVKFADETYATEQACIDSAKEGKYYESRHQIIAFCVEGAALLVSPKQYVPRPKK